MLVLTLRTILLVLAILAFVLAAFGVTSRINLTDVGLALVAAALLIR